MRRFDGDFDAAGLEARIAAARTRIDLKLLLRVMNSLLLRNQYRDIATVCELLE